MENKNECCKIYCKSCSCNYNYIILQKAFEFDKQDIEQGMDGEYLEVNGQENSGYKCCRNASISKDTFIVDIDSNEDEINRVEVMLEKVKINNKLLKYLNEILGDKLQVID
ncbi:Imm10 family immunity protein [Paenibacillus ginsengarvi]|uniref:Uncharacterized protein n=1 Tax=Paenibacillus ginsengarvi TaxID=400777 RepID=A0A3B0AR75_9BACL|nr:Imm10 family immunity protein [Paenibacillus ginsengarvi]RKN62998.1 hypothetical protein D7M11_34555 [Paenibacillus ginsengarvi]